MRFVVSFCLLMVSLELNAALISYVGELKVAEDAPAFANQLSGQINAEWNTETQAFSMFRANVFGFQSNAIFEQGFYSFEPSYSEIDSAVYYESYQPINVAGTDYLANIPSLDTACCGHYFSDGSGGLFINMDGYSPSRAIFKGPDSYAELGVILNALDTGNFRFTIDNYLTCAGCVGTYDNDGSTLMYAQFISEVPAPESTFLLLSVLMLLIGTRQTVRLV